MRSVVLARRLERRSCWWRCLPQCQLGFRLVVWKGRFCCSWIPCEGDHRNGSRPGDLNGVMKQLKVERNGAGCSILSCFISVPR